MTRADHLLLLIVICTLPLLYAQFWQQQGTASHIQVRAGNAAPVIAPLAADRTLHVHGPLGDSVIEVSKGLQAAGDMAACLPNRISLQIVGARPRFDSINF